MVLILYRLLFPFAFLCALPAYSLRLLRRERGRAAQSKPPGYHTGLGQRWGRYDAALRQRLSHAERPIWLCSISVGETLVALKIARALREREPSLEVVMSVTTSTGYELLLHEVARCPWLIPLYNPLDFDFAVQRALALVQPRALVLVEGGIWPVLLHRAHRQGVPVLLAAARLSPRSAKRWRRLRWIGSAVWRLFDAVWVPEAGDVGRFEAIGVPAGRVHHTGSVKLDNTAPEQPSRESELRETASTLGFHGPLIVAGSTWAPEEKALSAAYAALREQWPALRLVLVPRHVERAEEIMRELQPWRVARRSQPMQGEADVLLVDVTGELRDWYRLATVVFIGKSLPGVREVGGQNAGEPAALGKPVIFGPHMENFASLVRHLLAADAAKQIPAADALLPALQECLANPKAATEQGSRARTVLEPHQGATARTAEALAASIRHGVR